MSQEDESHGNDERAIDAGLWLPLSGLEAGFGAYRPKRDDDLLGRKFDIVQDDGVRMVFEINRKGRMCWSSSEESRALGSGAAEACTLADGLHVVMCHDEDHPDRAVVLIVDERMNATLFVTTYAGGDDVPGREPGTTSVTQTFRTGSVEGAPRGTTAFSRSTDLVGRRAIWSYSPGHVYEHTYLNPHWYTWQCLVGPEKAQADTDLCTVIRLMDGFFLFAWREKVIPCAAVTVADHRDPRRLRSVGMLFGPRPDSSVHSDATCFTFGGWGRLLSYTPYPADADPAAM